jgi:ERCC4-type nuclease
MARHWSIIQIDARPSSTFGAWQIRNKEFRENLEWAVVVPDKRETSAPVAQLLAELAARGIRVRQCSLPCC